MHRFIHTDLFTWIYYLIHWNKIRQMSTYCFVWTKRDYRIWFRELHVYILRLVMRYSVPQQQNLDETLGNYCQANLLGWCIPCQIALRWMSEDFTDDKSTLCQVLAWCRQARSHYLSQCWPRSILPYGVTRPQWVSYIELKLNRLATSWRMYVFPSLRELIYVYRTASWLFDTPRPSDIWIKIQIESVPARISNGKPCKVWDQIK